MVAVRVPWCLPWPMVLLPLAGCSLIQEDPADQDTTPGDTSGDAIGDVAPDTHEASGGDATVDAVPEIEVGPGGCHAFAVSGTLVANEVEGVFTLGGEVDLGLGGPLPDAVIFEFYSDATGSFDLGSGGNENYKTCAQCVRFVQDIDESGGVSAKNFFQKRGTLAIDPTTPPNGTRLSVTLSDLEMIEVTIRGADYHTTPVDNGACYVREQALTLATGSCEPLCGDHSCGPDGCGGECGKSCGATKTCRLDGSTCELTPSCVPIALAGELLNTAPGVFRIDVSEHGLGAVGEGDFLQIEFYKNATGTFDLAAPANRNYATCDQCVRLVVDGETELFQRKGELVVSDISVPIGDPETDGYADLQLRGIVLEQVIIDDQFNSMPLEGGGCIELLDGGIVSTLPE
jgi:hypothetical protein